eukprot:m.118197 g.118197  ORF g.118197 m.118197 type:complete len:483 (-) comp17200_c0_seq1:723-2171(-)
MSESMRVLAPQIEEFPIELTAMCIGGVGDEWVGDPRYGLWCYDERGTQGLRDMIDQAAAVGAELIVVGQNMNHTWRSEVGIEFQSKANMSWFKELVTHAAQGGTGGAGGRVEMGVYQLVKNARSATASNQAAPANAGLPGYTSGYDDMDPVTMQTCHKNHEATCRGGSGCCSLCSANAYFDAMRASMLEFWDTTGMTVIDQDGAEIGESCANVSHVHHHGLNDSIVMQWRAMEDTFREYMRRGGYIRGMPGNFYEGGQSKAPGGYDEETYSLPRWQWIHRTRQRMIADFQFRDRVGAQVSRYYPLPVTQYHPTAAGYASAATIEPIADHLLEYEWALSQTFGTGITASVRGYRIFDPAVNESRALVQKWFDFARRYRRVITSDFITLQWSNLTSWDGVFHAALPKHREISERGLAVFWNPLNHTLADVPISLPMYYTGARVGDTVSWREQEGAAHPVVVTDKKTIELSLTLRALGVTYVVVE